MELSSVQEYLSPQISLLDAADLNRLNEINELCTTIIRIELNPAISLSTQNTFNLNTLIPTTILDGCFTNVAC